MRGCSRCPWCYPVPFVNGANNKINSRYWCVLIGALCSNVPDCRHPGGKGLKGPRHPLSYYAKFRKGGR